MRDKRGVSAVVTTVIILALALIAVGVVWGVIRGVIQERGESTEVSSKCIDAEVEIVSAIFDTDTLTVNIRNAGSKTIDGARIAAGGDSSDTTATLDALETVDITLALTDAPTSVTAAAFFNTEAGEPVLCNTEVEGAVTDNTAECTAGQTCTSDATCCTGEVCTDTDADGTVDTCDTA